MRRSTFLTTICFLSLTMNAVLVVQAKRSSRSTEKPKTVQTAQSTTPPGNSVIETVKHLEKRLAGQPMDVLPWDQLTPLKPSTIFEDPALNAPYTLTMVFSVMGCNTCLNEQLGYIRRLTKHEDLDLSVQVLILDGRRDDVLRFKRIHRIKAPFFMDQGQAMSTALNLNGRMLLFLTDNHTERILAAHVPDPSLLERSQEFGAYILKLSGLIADAG